MTPIKWFWGFLKKYCVLLCIGLVMTTAISVLSIVNPYISGRIVDDVIRGLKSAAGYLRRELGHTLSLRATPELTFVRDDSMEKGAHILKIIEGLDK